MERLETALFQKGYMKENGQCTIGKNVYSKIYCGYKCLIIIQSNMPRSKVLLPLEVDNQEDLKHINRAFNSVKKDEQDLWEIL